MTGKATVSPAAPDFSERPYVWAPYSSDEQKDEE